LSEQDMADIGEYYAAQTASSPKNPLKWYSETAYEIRTNHHHFVF
jgi:cytochrome c553